MKMCTDSSVQSRGRVSTISHEPLVKVTMSQSDGTPIRSVRPKAKPSALISSFQKNEALVFTDNSDKFPKWPETQPNEYGNFVPSEVSGICIAPRAGPIPIKPTARPISPKATVARKVTTIAEPIREETSTSTLRAPLARAAAKKKADARRALTSTIDEPAEVVDMKSRRTNRNIVPNDQVQEKEINEAPINFLDILLRKAENLLHEVSSCAKSPAKVNDERMDHLHIRPSCLEPIPAENVLEVEAAVKKYTSDRNLKENFSNIDWLVRGIPEVFETECEVDDALVERLLKQGGPPPSELLFPSLHETSQRVMSKLSLIRRMNVSIRQLIIHNARSGVRKDCSFLTCTPPSGAGALAGSPLSSQLMLTELRSFTMYKRGQKVGLLDDYFSGKEELGKIVSWPLRLSDKSIRTWISGGDSGCLIIELYSYLSSPKARKLMKVDPIRIGYVKIPLGSLLTTESLDAVVTAEIVSDKNTSAAVQNRLLAMPGGAQLKNSKPLGPNIGLITLRVNLSSDENEIIEDDADVREAASQYKKFMGMPDPPFVLSNPLILSNSVEPDDSASAYNGKWNYDKQSQSELDLEEARKFVPQEGNVSSSGSIIKNKVLSHIGFVFSDIRINKDLLHGKLIECASLDGANFRNLKIDLGYKALNSERSIYRERISSSFCVISDDITSIPFFCARLHLDNDMSCWNPPVFEVWVTDDSNNMVLVGLGSLSLDCLRFNEMLEVSIESIITGHHVGSIRLAFILGVKTSDVDCEVQSIIAMEKLERLTEAVISLFDLLPEPLRAASIVDKIVLPTEQPPEYRVRESLESLYSVDSLSFPQEQDKSSSFEPVHEAIDASSPTSIEKKDFASELNITLSSEDVHILDFVLSETFKAVHMDETVGCVVLYSLVELRKFGIQIENDEQNQLWWDCEHSFSNSRIRHRLKFTSDFDLQAVLNSTESICFRFIESIEYNSFAETSEPLTEFYFAIPNFINLLSDSYNDRLIWLSAEDAEFSIALNVSHRLEPVLYSSVQTEAVHSVQSTIHMDDSGRLDANVLSVSDNQKPSVDLNHFSFKFEIMELRGLIVPATTNAYELYLFCTCSVCFTEELNSIANSFGSDTYITSPVIFSGKPVGWAEPGSVELFVSSYEKENLAFLRNTVLKVNLHLRSKFMNPFVDSRSAEIRQELQVGDQVLGTVVVDLSPLSRGFPFICGWYEVFDNFQKSLAFMKVRVDLPNADLHTHTINSIVIDGSASNLVPSIYDGVTSPSGIDKYSEKSQKWNVEPVLSLMREEAIPTREQSLYTDSRSICSINSVLEIESATFSEAYGDEIVGSPDMSKEAIPLVENSISINSTSLDSKLEEQESAKDAYAYANEMKGSSDADSSVPSTGGRRSESSFSDDNPSSDLNSTVDRSDAAVVLSSSMLSMLDSYLNVDRDLCSPSATPSKAPNLAEIFVEDSDIQIMSVPSSPEKSMESKPIISTSIAIYLCSSDSSDEVDDDSYMLSDETDNIDIQGTALIAAGLSEDIFHDSVDEGLPLGDISGAAVLDEDEDEYEEEILSLASSKILTPDSSASDNILSAQRNTPVFDVTTAMESFGDALLDAKDDLFGVVVEQVTEVNNDDLLAPGEILRHRFDDDLIDVISNHSKVSDNEQLDVEDIKGDYTDFQKIEIQNVRNVTLGNEFTEEDASSESIVLSTRPGPAQLLTDLPEDDIPPNSPFYHYMSPLSDEGPDDELIDLIVFHKAPETDSSEKSSMEEVDDTTRYYSINTTCVLEDSAESLTSSGIFHLTSPEDQTENFTDKFEMISSPWISDSRMRSKIELEVQEISPMPQRYQQLENDPVAIQFTISDGVDISNLLIDPLDDGENAHDNGKSIDSEASEGSEISHSGVIAIESVLNNITLENGTDSAALSTVGIDSPITAKVRRVVAEEFSKVLPVLDVSRANSKSADCLKSKSVENVKIQQEHQCDDTSVPPPLSTEVNRVHGSTRVDAKEFKSRNSSLSIVEKEVQALLARAGISSDLQRSRQSSLKPKLPGKWKSFVDKETEQISRIMMGLSKSEEEFC